MSDCLSDLPTELIENILDHISIVDIFSSVCFVNKRLYSVTFDYSRFSLDFNCIGKTKKQFDFICNHHLTSRIASLTFDNDDNGITNAKNIRFLCSINVNDIFPNLHSITINKIDSNIWNTIQTRLSSFIVLRSISIGDVHDDSNPALMSLILHDLLFTVRSLKYLSLGTSFGRNEPITISSSSFVMQTSAIERLILTGISINLHELFIVAPILRQLDARLIVNQSFYDEMIFQPPFNLQQLSIKTDHITILEIKRLLSSMIRLTHLTLDIDNTESDLINGHTWIPLLTRIIVFQFVFRISRNDNIDLDSFRTQFWLEEKKWYVTFDQWIDNYDSFLYTNPCCTSYNYPLPFMKKILVTESTGLEPMTYPHNEYLFFDYHLPMQEEHLGRFTHAHTLLVKSDLSMSLESIIRCIDLSRIIHFLQGDSEKEEASNEFVRILHSLPHLRSLCLNISTLILLFDRHWPQITNLNMKSSSFDEYRCLSSTRINALWRSFTHLKEFAFDRQSVRKLSKLFNDMPMTLSNIHIRHYGNLYGYKPELITRQWLEQKTKLNDFDYFHENERNVYLWL